PRLSADRALGGAISRRGAGDPHRRCQPHGRWPATGARGMTAASDGRPALQVKGLGVSYLRHGRALKVLSDVSFDIRRGEACGLGGESGCGKTTVAMAVMRYLAPNARVDGGRIMFHGIDLLTAREAALRDLRGNRMAMVYQDPGSALNPSLTIGRQIAEV